MTRLRSGDRSHQSPAGLMQILCPVRTVVLGVLWSHLGGLLQVDHDLAE